MTEGYEQV